MAKTDTAVIVPNWNGRHDIGAALDSLKNQSYAAHVIVVDNGSVDESADFIRENYPEVELLQNATNLGFAGGVNTGIRPALAAGYKFIGLLNNDAVAAPNWLKDLRGALSADKTIGISTCKMMDAAKKHLDSTGDMYTAWGLPYPRGRGEPVSDKYDQDVWVFSASGGASLYRSSMLEQIGLFDEDFFAYYEDVDLSFRAQLAGWKIRYVPSAEVYHQIGATSARIKGFTTYQTLKNLPSLLAKNVPRRYMWRIFPRYILAHIMFFGKAFSRGQGGSAIRGDARGTVLLFKARVKRRQIKRLQTVSDDYIWGMITHDLPPNAHKLRTLRRQWRKLTGKADQ